MADPTENNQDSLTEESFPSITDLVKEVTASEGEPEPTEIPEDDEDEEPSEAGPGDEPGEQAEEDSAEPEESDDEDQTPEPEAAPEIKEPDELSRLRAQNEQLLAAMGQLLAKGPPAAQQAPVPRSDPTPEVSEDAVRLALFGGNEEQWKRIPESEKARALKIAEDYARREVKAALSPKARYEQIREQVLSEVAAFLDPVMSDFHQRRAAEIVQKHLDPIKDPTVRKRAEALFRENPGSASTSWKDLDTVLGTSVKLAMAEAREKAVAEKKAKIESEKKQDKAAKHKLKNRSATPGAVAKKVAPPASLKDGESLMEFYERLKSEYSGR